MNNKISIHICSKDRHSELFGCLLSLRNQTIKNWDLMLLDESQTPIPQCYFLASLLNRLKLEGHRIKLISNAISKGVCNARQQLIDNDSYGNYFTLRLDDDCILTTNYIEKLLEVIDKGFDMASGVIPLLARPELKRENRFVRPIINRIDVDKEGDITKYADDCGFDFLEDEIIPASNFRTNLLYKSEINNKVKYEIGKLSFVSFREEAFFSLKTILQGYKLAVRTGAKCYHLFTASGGCRSNPQLYAQNVKQDDEQFRIWLKNIIKKEGNFLEKYYKKVLK